MVQSTTAPTLQAFVRQQTVQQTHVYTDEAAAYVGLPRPHGAVKHSAREYVNGERRNGMTTNDSGS